MKKLLFLEDLYEYYSKNKISHYSASENNGEPLYVQTHGTIVFDQSKNTEGLLFADVMACHIDENINKSYIGKKEMEAAMPSLINRPVLGYMHKVDGEWQFYGHNIEINEDGEYEYQEIPVGHFPESCEPTLEYDKDMDKTYVNAKVVIYEDYTHAAEILRREGKCSVSVELAIRDLGFDAEKKLLIINDFFFSGCTILGMDDEGNVVKPGMVGSNITLTDFSQKNNSCFSEQILNALNEVKETLSSLNNKFKEKEGGDVKLKLQELLEKYAKTIEDITFDTEGLTDEELEAKFKEAFDEEKEEEKVEEQLEKVDDDNTFSVEVKGKKYSFAVSLDEIIYALSTIVNDTYSEADNAYYSVKVYEKYVVMVDCWTGRAYRQNYKSRNGVYSLTGDRVEVYARYLTKEEENALDDMKSKFESMEADLKKYTSAEVLAAKKDILNNADYDAIREEQEFIDFSEEALAEENADKYTVEEVSAKCDALLLDYAKKNMRFSGGKSFVKIPGQTTKKEEGPYGSLFDED